MPISPSKAPPPYQYRCVDKSWLTGVLAATVVPQIERRLPLGMPANLITLLSSACLGVMVSLQWLAPDRRSAALLAGIGLLVAYTLLDMVDGQRARRLGTSSPLGEYLDHTLDIFNAAVVVTMVFLVRPSASPVALAWLLAAMGLAFAAALVEQRVGGILRLGAIGPVEALLLVGCYLASRLVPGADAWWEQAAIGGWTRFEIAAAVAGCGIGLAAILSVWRLRQIPWPLAMFATGSLVFLALLHEGVGTWGMLLALVFWSADFGGRVICSHLQHERLPRPDAVGFGLALVLLGLALTGVRLPWLQFAPVAWLAVRFACHVAATVRGYRQYWTWWHRPTPGVPAAVSTAVTIR
ncbi:MAG TPA: CDP-alcohol phosphatidyltransferase family protein [Opitutaceae bacterium]|nr:CDP-alcohol phosphatidyltransferase family protein [Opitutaceae bacterium]